MDLKLSRDAAFTTSFGREFHSLIVWGKNENLKMSFFALGTKNLKSWLPREPVHVLTVHVRVWQLDSYCLRRKSLYIFLELLIDMLLRMSKGVSFLVLIAAYIASD